MTLDDFNLRFYVVLLHASVSGFVVTGPLCGLAAQLQAGRTSSWDVLPSSKWGGLFLQGLWWAQLCELVVHKTKSCQFAWLLTVAC